MIFANRRLKTKKYLQMYLKVRSNIDTDIRTIYKDRINIQPILSNYRKLTKITPGALKDKTNKQYKENRLLVIYIILNYTSVSDETLIEEFDILKEDIAQIKQDHTLKSKYKLLVKCFFNNLKSGYLENELSVLYFQEKIYMESDEYEE